MKQAISSLPWELGSQGFANGHCPYQFSLNNQTPKKAERENTGEGKIKNHNTVKLLKGK